MKMYIDEVFNLLEVITDRGQLDRLNQCRMSHNTRRHCN